MNLTKREITFQKILDQASRVFREKGIQGTSVQDVMRAAGLTVGGFYAHFDSKEDLIRRAFLKMTEQAKKYADSLRSATARGRLREFTEIYLSARHRDNPGAGCAFAALAIEMGRSSEELRAVFSEELLKMAGHRRRILSDDQNTLSEDDSLALMSIYVGGLLLSRATQGHSVSERILKSTRDLVEKSFGKDGLKKDNGGSL